ncbi:MAG: 4-aminobutyrate--2-oxoglutarate transaminase [Alphaproteobacteria bacterium]|nr:4-aminobutyrate--2-oxoglutarate transaminase [Alphaproteobacteria bacterium]
MLNQDLLKRRTQSVPRGVATIAPVFVAKAKNSEIWDVEGKRYIDFAGGIAVLNTGHSHPKIIDAVSKQLQNYNHTAFQVIGYESYITLAEKLNQLAPTGENNKTIFFSTGAEALENSIKIARAATKRSAIIAFTGGFHGRTMMTLAMTGKIVPYKSGFGPFPAEVYHIPFPNKLHNVAEEDSFKALESLFKTDVEPSRVAAIVIEPIQGEGGFYIAPFNFLKQLRDLCTHYGILLIADEVQSGIARTGKMFAIEHSKVKPDLITVAKSLAGGFPLSAVVGKSKIMDQVEPGGLGGTYAGNPLACVAGLTVLDIIQEEKLLERAQIIGKKMTDFLNNMAQSNQFNCIGEVRGLGAMVAFELVKDRMHNEPDSDLTKALVSQALKNNLIILSCGTYGNVIRLLMPLTIQDELLVEGLETIKSSLEQVFNVKN